MASRQEHWSPCLATSRCSDPPPRTTHPAPPPTIKPSPTNNQTSVHPPATKPPPHPPSPPTHTPAHTHTSTHLVSPRYQVVYVQRQLPGLLKAGAVAAVHHLQVEHLVLAAWGGGAGEREVRREERSRGGMRVTLSDAKGIELRLGCEEHDAAHCHIATLSNHFWPRPLPAQMIDSE